MKADNQMKRIVVLGATSGIGRVLVILLREKGYDVIATGRRKALLDSLGGETLELDVTAPNAIQRIAALKADTVIFNAGFGERTPLPDPTRTEQALQVNVLAFERFAQWALTQCQCFVATASIAGIRGLEDTNGYSASKAYMINAMEGYRRKARHDKHPCRYVTLMPGFVDTAMGQASTFWRCSPECAAKVIWRGLCAKKPVIYVTPRWKLIAILLKMLPRAIFERIPIK
jgi:short-subunit dehydrogenase